MFLNLVSHHPSLPLGQMLRLVHKSGAKESKSTRKITFKINPSRRRYEREGERDEKKGGGVNREVGVVEKCSFFVCVFMGVCGGGREESES